MENSEDPIAVTAGDESAFTRLTERYRAELRVHCYRMLGSLDESEDLVQETFLRAWRGRESYAGKATFRAWLYRIATNACLDVLDRRTRDPLAKRVTGPTPGPAAVEGLQPFPDHLLDQVVATDAEPGAVVVARETIELAFLAAIQRLPARQRAVLILRDVLGWPASDTAGLLETSVASVNSALQRARPALRTLLPEPRLRWAQQAPTGQERQVLHDYVDALQRADHAALAELLREDVRCSQQPWAGGNMTPRPVWYLGRETALAAWAPLWAGPERVELRMLPTAANRQPAFGMYVRADRGGFRGFALTVLGVVDGRIADVAAFHPDLFPAFGLPPTV